MSREELVMDMIGELSDKFIAEALPKSVGSEKSAEHHELDFASDKKPEMPQITPKDIRHYHIRNAVIGGLAAAFVIAAGVFVWNMLKNAPPVKPDDLPSDSVNTSVTENTADAPVVTVPDHTPDIRDLNWGMTVDEVKEHENEQPLSDALRNENDNAALLRYSNIAFEGYDSEMDLTVSDTDGLEKVIYSITSDDGPEIGEIYDKINEVFNERYGDSYYISEYGEPIWFDKKNGYKIQVGWRSQYTIYCSFTEYTEDSGTKQTDSFTPLENGYPVRNDDIHTLFDERSLEIFRNYFYGVWRCEGEISYLSDLHLTYSEDCFDLGHACYPGSIVETDELYALTFVNGGEPSCYAVFKNDPDVLYECAYNLYNGDIPDCEYAVYPTAGSTEYTGRVQAEAPYLRSGKLSNLGQHRLMYEMGDDFAEFYNETLLKDSGYDGGCFTDETGKSWVIASSLGYPRDTRYLVSYDNYSDEPSVTVGIPYYEKNEYEAHDYLDEDEEVSWKKYYALTFFKNTAGNWNVTYQALDDVYEEAETMTFEAPRAENMMTASLVCRNVQKIYGNVNFTSAMINVTDTVTGKLLANISFATPLSGLDLMESRGDPEVRIYSRRPSEALVAVYLPLGDKQDNTYLPHLFWYDYEGITDISIPTDPGAEFPDLSVKSPDDLTLSGDRVIHIIDSKGIEKWYKVDEIVENSNLTGITVTESDCVGVTAADRAKVYEFPIKEFADDEVKLICGDIKPAEELVEFHSYNSAAEEWDIYGVGEFLDSLGVPELKRLYYSGNFIACMPVSFFISQADGYNGLTYFNYDGNDCESDAAVIEAPHGNTGNKVTFFASGFSCDSVLAAFPKIFTDEWEPVMLDRFGYGFIKYGEELYCTEGGIGDNLSHIYTEYELVKQTDTEVIFNAIAYDYDYIHSDGSNPAVYDPAKKDEYLKRYQTFRFVKTADGWRIAYSPTGWDWY